MHVATADIKMMANNPMIFGPDSEVATCVATCEPIDT